MIPASQPDPSTLQVAKPPPTKSSVVRAGWICLVLGFLTFWIFGLGFVFFVATFILAIVAMATNRVGQGIVLLVSSVGSSIVCVIISLALLSSAFTAALKKERAKRTEQRGTPVELQHATATETSLQNLLGPAKGSLIVNINTASAKELESLPSIGSSRAEQIIAHRPYTSVDELSQVKGVTPRVLDQLRPFVKTDGATEPRSP
jgi:Helix-hairpin-helix motif